MFIFLYGSNTFLGRQKLRELKNKFIREIDPNQSSLTVLDGASITIAQLHEKIASQSLLTKRRMIIIENLFLNKNKIILEDFTGCAQETNKDNIIIFFEPAIKTKRVRNKKEVLLIDSSGRERILTQKQLQLFNFLSKQKYTQEFKDLSNIETSVWITREVQKRGGKINNQAVQTLLELIGNDLWQINNEINKLINYKNGLIRCNRLDSCVKIEVNDVKQLVRGKFDENIFTFTDAISNKNKALAIKLLEEQYQAGLTSNYLLSMIVRQFRILLQIKQALSLGFTYRKIISLLKLHPFVIQKGINQAKFFTLADLKNILSKLVEIDYLFKTGQGEIRVMLDLFIVHNCI